jgi:hypothetical protein
LGLTFLKEQRINKFVLIDKATMESSQHIHTFTSPKGLEMARKDHLKRLLNQYPWCSTLHLLLLKKLYDSNDPEYQLQLKASAIQIPDRSVLYHLMVNHRFSVPTPDSPQPFTTPEPETVDPKTPDVHEEPSTSPPALHVVVPEVPVSIPTPQKVSLIDQFIKAEPRIVPKEGDFAESVMIAEKSNIPAFDLVTETLANCYLQQGNKNKAIKIFEHLSLTIPEKSSYFAARITEIRKTANRL